MKSISFTGHRNFDNSTELTESLSKILEKLINKGYTDFYSGGAYGFDTMCEIAVLNLRNRYTYIKLHVVLPCPFEEMTKKWTYPPGHY